MPRRSSIWWIKDLEGISLTSKIRILPGGLLIIGIIISRWHLGLKHHLIGDITVGDYLTGWTSPRETPNGQTKLNNNGILKILHLNGVKLQINFIMGQGGCLICSITFYQLLKTLNKTSRSTNHNSQHNLFLIQIIIIKIPQCIWQNKKTWLYLILSIVETCSWGQ